ncbi:MAG: restriction endonuclease subunit S [Cellulosimicrobium cellulans]
MKPGWTKVALGEILTWVSGGTPKRSVSEYYGPGIPWLSIADLGDGPVRTARESLTSHGLKNSAAKKIPAGTIVIAMYGSIGKLGLTQMTSCTSQAIAAAIDLEDSIDRGYLWHFLLSSRARIQQLGRGNTQSNIGLGDLRNLLIELPPLDEQRQIAAVLDHVDALRSLRREGMQFLDALEVAALNRTLEHTTRTGVPLGSIVRVTGGKRLPKGSDYATGRTPYRYIRVTDLRNGGIDQGELLYLTAEVQARISRYTVSAGDVVISIAGSIGVTAVVPPELEGANLTENAARLHPLDSDQLDGTFLAHALRSPNLKSQIVGHTGKVTIGKLALFRIEKLEVPLPSIDAQRKFAAEIGAIGTSRSAHREHLAQLDVLFASLRSRAFAGELDVDKVQIPLA